MTQAKPKPKLAFEEFLEYDDGTDTRYELVDGVPVEVAPESRLNDRLAMRLMGFLLPFVGSMERFSKGVQIEVTPLPGMKNQTRVFDLAVIPSELEAILGDGQIITRKMPNPLLVVEFVSSYSSTGAKNYQRDYIEKRKQYEQRQIPEYWIIDATAQKITVLTLKDKSFLCIAFVL
ncbi:MAG: Uma2 family endonuclease [Cyanobacteria bacterium J06639_14]